MSFKTWLSITTLALIALIIYLSRKEIFQAWHLLANVNIWILMLLIPGQIFVYYVGGEMMFSYLRAKDEIKNVKAKDLIEMALEMNFVNHVLPSGGMSGISYMTWRLNKLGIPAGRATMSQLVRFAMTFAAYIVLVLISVVVITIDGNINRWIIFVSFSLVLITLVVGVGTIYLLSSRERMWRFADKVVINGNRLVKKLTFGRKKQTFRYAQVEKFFSDMHFDYVALRRDKNILVKPFLWGIVFTLGDVFLYVLAFWAMGVYFNPAPLLIAYGIAGLAGLVVITPGGAGAYEAAMITFLAIAGISQSQAIAGVLLARIVLLLGTILLGYVFYQRAILKYGKYKSATSRG